MEQLKGFNRFPYTMSPLFGFPHRVENIDAITGQILIWDVTDPNSIVLDGSGNVQIIKDKSGTGNDMVPATSSVRPAFTSSGGSNNLPYLQVAGGKTYGISSFNRSIVSTPMTIYWVCKLPSTSPSSGQRCMNWGSSTEGIFFNTSVASGSANTWAVYTGITPFFSSLSAQANRTDWMLVKIVVKDIDSFWVEINNEPNGFLRDGGGPGNLDYNAITRIAVNGYVGTQWSELRVFNKVTSPTEDSAIRNTLIAKYNIQWPSLPYSVYFGDSHTAGVESGVGNTLGGYMQRITNLGTRIINNYAVSGTTVDPGGYNQSVGSNLVNYYPQFLNSSLANKYKVVFQYGTNDAAISQSAGAPTLSAWKATYKSIIQTYIENGWSAGNIIICTPPYSTGTYVSPGAVNRLPSYYTTIVDISNELGITLCDFYQAMITAVQDCGLVPSGDGIHGNDAIHTTLLNTLTPLL